MFSVLQHPYPTEDEKRTIAAQTNLTLLQVRCIFAAGRRHALVYISVPNHSPRWTTDRTGEQLVHQRTTKDFAADARACQRLEPAQSGCDGRRRAIQKVHVAVFEEPVERHNESDGSGFDDRTVRSTGRSAATAQRKHQPKHPWHGQRAAAVAAAVRQQQLLQQRRERGQLRWRRQPKELN